jgi:hypothetical protein
MNGWKLLVARSEARAKDIHKFMGLGEGWKCIGYFDALAGLPIERIIVCDFRDIHVDVEKADKWLDEVVRLRLRPGCENNVWTV